MSHPLASEPVEVTRHLCPCRAAASDSREPKQVLQSYPTVALIRLIHWNFTSLRLFKTTFMKAGTAHRA